MPGLPRCDTDVVVGLYVGRRPSAVNTALYTAVVDGDLGVSYRPVPDQRADDFVYGRGCV